MIIKLFELRDAGTFLPMMAIKLKPGNERHRFMLARTGYGLHSDSQADYVMLCDLEGGTGKATTDPYEWRDRTRQVAHRFIIDNFHSLEDGQVIDVQFILGETTAPKLSEAMEAPL